jgi:hypothetical protein
LFVCVLWWVVGLVVWVVEEVEEEEEEEEEETGERPTAQGCDG